MAMTETRIVREFEAEGRSGDRYVIQVCRDFVARSDRGRGERITWTGGAEYMRTADGRAVAFLEHHRYQINGEPPIMVTTSDPNAP
jgi:hypothetical protein